MVLNCKKNYMDAGYEILKWSRGLYKQKVVEILEIELIHRLELKVGDKLLLRNTLEKLEEKYPLEKKIQNSNNCSVNGYHTVKIVLCKL